MISVGGSLSLKNKVKNSTVIYKGDDANSIIELEKLMDYYKNNNDNGNEGKINKSETNITYKGEIDLNDSNMSISLLGEIMLGGEVSKNLEYLYAQAIKKIYINTRLSDFTYANFSTNIVSNDDIDKLNSKYLATYDALTFLNALGIDSISIASDHMVDLGKEKFEDTVSILNSNSIYVAGIKDKPIYFEKNGKRVAIISTNSILTSNVSSYNNLNISVYSKENLSKNIKEAKEYADIVIADIHWGNEFSYGVTENMRNIAISAIDSGVDMVIGSHAAGVYPIIQYKGKPIIYSLGYFIGDSDLYVGKESFIFNLNINKDGIIDTLEMIPIYIKDKKEVVLYNEYSEEKSKEYLEQFNNWNVENSMDSKIIENKIIIDLTN